MAPRLRISEARVIDVISAIAKGIKFLLLGQSPSQIAAALGGQDDGRVDMLGGADPTYHPKWDLVTVRATATTQFLLDSFLNDRDFMVQEAKRLAVDGNLDLSPTIDKFEDSDFDRICQFRYLRWRSKPEAQRTEVELCPRLDKKEFEQLGAITRNLFHSNADLDAARVIQGRELVTGAFPGRNPKFKYYIYGHTHQAGLREVKKTDDPSWKPWMINTGAWQRVASARQLQRIFLDLKGKAPVLEQDPEKLPPCYTYIYVGPYGKEGPEPKLLHWVLEDEKKKLWKTWARCPEIYEADVP
jgi:hypothetical protein